MDYNVRADHGQCATAAPGTFQVDDEGRLVFAANPQDIFRANVEDAAGACPGQAITIRLAARCAARGGGPGAGPDAGRPGGRLA